MARRPKRADRDNNDRWLVSYADFITLLFAFFVVMYAISSVNEGKYKVLSTSINSAFSRMTLTLDTDTKNMDQDELLHTLVDRRNARIAKQQRKQQEYMQNLFDNLSRVLAPLVSKGQVSVIQSGRGIVLDLNVSALFQEGDATLQPKAVQTLAAVAKVLQPGDLAIQVEGHTDNIPISTARFPSNWELSSARASSVVRLFVKEGVDGKRLTAAGVADNQPLVPNDTPEHRAKNRRVTVTILTPQTPADTAEPEAKPGV
jgi:chemotaxis protein MotB